MGTVRELVNLVHTKDTHAEIRFGIELIPESLTTIRILKRAELVLSHETGESLTAKARKPP
jgi:hypothetical protein